MSKKCKLSGLSSQELLPAYNSLLNLKKTIVHDSEADPNEPAPEGFKQEVDKTLSLLRSRLEGPKSPTFSTMSSKNLTRLNITLAGVLCLKPNLEERIAATTSLGQDKLWSSPNLYRHLHLLETLIPRTTEASARAWIDAFFFRASAMLPEAKRMVLNMEHAVPATTISPSSLRTLSGLVDYTAVVASEHIADTFLKTPNLHILRMPTQFNMPSGFFVIEANLYNPSEHVPQAVSEIYMCGKLLRKKILRGALTNGRDWIFLLVKLNDNYDGASYMQSSVIKLETAHDFNGQMVISDPWPNLIAAILSYWIENSSEYFGNDDWFELVYY